MNGRSMTRAEATEALILAGVPWVKDDVRLVLTIADQQTI